MVSPSTRSGRLRAVCLLAAAVHVSPALAADSASTPTVIDTLQKGVVGKVLDAVPMDPEQRAALQRASAVASGTATGRTLTTWAGFTHPLLTFGGFLWGVVSAQAIRADLRGRWSQPPAPVEERVVAVLVPGEPGHTGGPRLQAVADVQRPDH